MADQHIKCIISVWFTDYSRWFISAVCLAVVTNQSASAFQRTLLITGSVVCLCETPGPSSTSCFSWVEQFQCSKPLMMATLSWTNMSKSTNTFNSDQNPAASGRTGRTGTIMWQPKTTDSEKSPRVQLPANNIHAGWQVGGGTRESEQPFDPGVGGRLHDGANFIQLYCKLHMDGEEVKNFLFFMFFSTSCNEWHHFQVTWGNVERSEVTDCCRGLQCDDSPSYHHSMFHQQRWAVMFYCNLITFFK